MSIEVGEGENPAELGATSDPKSSVGRCNGSKIQAARATRLSWVKGENQVFPLPPYIPARLRQPPSVPPNNHTVSRFKSISLDLKKKMLFLGFLLASSCLALPLDVDEAESTNAKSGNLKVNSRFVIKSF